MLEPYSGNARSEYWITVPAPPTTIKCSKCLLPSLFGSFSFVSSYMLYVLVLWLTPCFYWVSVYTMDECVCVCYVHKVLHKSRSVRREIKSEKETWRCHKKKYGKSTIEWKISRLLFGKQENKRKCVNKVFNENAGFFCFFPSYLYFFVCICFYSFWPNQSHWPNGSSFPSVSPYPSIVILRWLPNALHQFYSLVNQTREYTTSLCAFTPFFFFFGSACVHIHAAMMYTIFHWICWNYECKSMVSDFFFVHSL